MSGKILDYLVNLFESKQQSIVLSTNSIFEVE